MDYTIHAPRPYVMHDQVREKVRAIMDTAGPGTNEAQVPMLSRPGWVAITLLVIAFNLMAVLPPTV